MGVVEAEGMCWKVTVEGFLGAGGDGSMGEGTSLSGRAEDEAMQADTRKPEAPHSLPSSVVTCRDGFASTSVKKKFKNLNTCAINLNTMPCFITILTL